TEEGHDVVMTPNSHCYFDHYQGPQDDEPLAWGGYLPLSKVYTFDPIVESMTAEQAKHVLGGQANLWTEYMSTSAQLEYMIYPRVAALSEAVWSTKDNRRWDDFANRVESLLDRYSQMDINYAKSAYLISADADMDIVDMTVGITLENELPKSDIRYSINGGELTKYIEPVQLKETTNIQAVLFKNDEPIGKEFNKTINFHKAVGKKIKYKTPFHKSYQGAGEYGMVNTIRGTKNFHDGQWQAWLGEDMEATIDFGSTNKVSTVSVGVLESQGPGIYHPTGIEVYTSTDGNSFEKIAEVKRAYKPSGIPELKDFILTFEEQQATHVRVKVVSLKKHPLNGGTVWLFVDEILVE
ncbi:MAG: hexosaminidase, partial [Bacteroidia bacterium]